VWVFLLPILLSVIFPPTGVGVFAPHPFERNFSHY
jgi:hypothetical protein